jgi:hypothetical protein
MLSIAERVTEFAAISSRELPPLCAIAPALDSARTVANAIVETFIVNFSLWSVNDPNHTDGSGSVADEQLVRVNGGTDDLAQRVYRQLTHRLQLVARREASSGYPAFSRRQGS